MTLTGSRYRQTSRGAHRATPACWGYTCYRVRLRYYRPPASDHRCSARQLRRRPGRRHVRADRLGQAQRARSGALPAHRADTVPRPPGQPGPRRLPWNMASTLKMPRFRSRPNTLIACPSKNKRKLVDTLDPSSRGTQSTITPQVRLAGLRRYAGRICLLGSLY
jgi:hypothetical protein